MHTRKLILLNLTFVTYIVASFQAASADQPREPDLAKIDRTIRKQPEYASKHPLYGFLVFGPKAATRVAAVFDKSAPTSPEYDVLYFDRNANGDLTEANERIVGKPEGKESFIFSVGSFTDPATSDVHTEVTFQTWIDSENDPFGVDIYVKWKDKHVVHSGFSERPIAECSFRATLQSAPVFWFGGDAPLRVNRWGWTKLTIGTSQDITVLLGYRGIGRGSFSAHRQDYLPASLPILATLIYTDRSGKERQYLAKLRERC